MESPVGSVLPFQGFIDGAAALVMALGGLILKGLKDEQTEQRERHNDLARTLPDTYARRDDLKAAVEDVKISLRRIEDRLGTTPPH